MAKDIVNEALQRYIKIKYSDFQINQDDFNTVKFQFDALGLIKFSTGKTVSGGMAEFMQLTNKGIEKLKLLKVKKRTKVTNLSVNNSKELEKSI